MLTVKQISSRTERQIATAMITSSRYAAVVAPHYKPEFMTSPHIRKVTTWAVTHYNKYGSAPKKAIATIFASENRNKLDEDTADLISEFLTDISKEYSKAKKLNVDYLVDQTDRYFKERGLKMLAEDLETSLSADDLVKAQDVLMKYGVADISQDNGVEPLTDKHAMVEAIEAKEKDALFKMPGELGRFLGAFERDMFVTIQGPEKRGKTYWLIEIAMRALKARCNVAVFEAGDMSRNQFIRRILAYVTETNTARADTIKKPVLDCQHNQDDTCEWPEHTNHAGGVMQRTRQGDFRKLSADQVPDYKPCIVCRREPQHKHRYKGAVWHETIEVKKLTAKIAIEGTREFNKRYKRRLKLATHPNNTLTVSGIQAQLAAWERADGFVPDVIVVDYADILATEGTGNDYRHQINDTWQRLRTLSQTHHCLVVTATQADADSYDKRTIREKNFSEDKRKYGHIQMVITLNQTREEKTEGIMRIGTMFVREDAYNARKTVTVLECKTIGKPYLASY